MRYLIGALFAAFIVFATVGASDCGEAPPTKDKSEGNRQDSVESRAANFEQARLKFPQPVQSNFPMREALVKYTQRQDLLAHPWYIYVSNECFQCPGGLAFRYYVGQTYPQSTCNFLGSTEEIKVWKGDGYASVEKVQAPSLDGIFYGSGATTGGCDYFFFDLSTDAMLVLHHDWKWFVSDKLLVLDATPVSVRPGP